MLANSFSTNRNAQAIEALYATGYSLHEQGRAADALLVFRAMITIVPRDERGWVALGDCHELLGQHTTALDLYTLGCIAAAPAPRCELARARLLRADDRDDEASVALERAIDAAQRIDDNALVELAQREQGRPS
jgi:tetratricopeptide (TPR) repeat protein